MQEVHFYAWKWCLIHLILFIDSSNGSCRQGSFSIKLNRIRTGIKADKRVTDRQKRAKKEVPSLFCGGLLRKPKLIRKWHGAIGLAYRDQDFDNNELLHAVLGERDDLFIIGY